MFAALQETGTEAVTKFRREYRWRPAPFPATEGNAQGSREYDRLGYSVWVAQKGYGTRWPGTEASSPR